MAKSTKDAKSKKKARKELSTVAALEKLFGKGAAKRMRKLAEDIGAKKAKKTGKKKKKKG